MAGIVFFVSFALLALEVFNTRLFSVLLWRTSAFVVLSVALLGLGAGGLAVYLLPSSWKARGSLTLTPPLMPLLGLSFPLAYVGTQLVSMTIRNPSIELIGYFALSAVALLPFLIGGMILSEVFASVPAKISRLYFLDLVGAALGAALLLPLLTALNGPLVVPLLGSLVTLVGIAYALRIKKPRVAVAGVLALAMIATLPAVPGLGDLLRIRWAKGKPEEPAMIERWGSESRITVFGAEDRSAWISIDSGVGTPVIPFRGDFEKVAYLRHNVLQLAYQVRDFESVAIIGSGGGSDVLAALTSGVQSVTAIEVNRAIVELMRSEPLSSWSGGLYARPEVDLHVADGRSFVAALDRQVDLVQATFVDTRTASSTGSHTLSENYVYSVEAFHDYLDHVPDDGMVSMSRWGSQQGHHRATKHAETLRVITTAKRALEEKGVERPQDHIVAVQGPEDADLVLGAGYQRLRAHMDAMATTLVKKTPFEPAELERLAQIVDANHFRPLWIPGSYEDHEIYRPLLTADGSDAFYRRWYEDNAVDLSPVYDDRPFFFAFVKPQDYFRLKNHAVWQGERTQPAAYLTLSSLWKLLAATSLLAGLLLGVPLLVRRKLRFDRGVLLLLSYFVALGLGFIGIEIGFIQRFSLFLGHPTYAFVVVLTAVLTMSGLGSLSTGQGRDRAARRAWHSVLGLFAILAAYALILPPLVAALLDLFLVGKVLIAVLLIAPPAFLMGRLIPLGVKVIERDSPEMIPWAWALSSGFSVLGSTLSMLIAMGWGYSVSWWCYSLIYLAGGVCMSRSDAGR